MIDISDDIKKVFDEMTTLGVIISAKEMEISKLKDERETLRQLYDAMINYRDFKR